MSQEERKNKSEKLRPLRIALAILVVILFVIILDRLPTSRSSRANSTTSENAGEPVPEGKEYLFMSGFLDILEDMVINRLKELGIPEEEYEHVVEYLSDNELHEIEAKIKLATKLENVYVETAEDDKKTIKKIFDLDSDYSFEKFQKSDTIPDEYVIFTDLLKEYQENLSSKDDR